MKIKTSLYWSTYPELLLFDTAGRFSFQISTSFAQQNCSWWNINLWKFDFYIVGKVKHFQRKTCCLSNKSIDCKEESFIEAWHANVTRSVEDLDISELLDCIPSRLYIIVSYLKLRHRLKAAYVSRSSVRFWAGIFDMCVLFKYLFHKFLL